MESYWSALTNQIPGVPDTVLYSRHHFGYSEESFRFLILECPRMIRFRLPHSGGVCKDWSNSHMPKDQWDKENKRILSHKYDPPATRKQIQLLRKLGYYLGKFDTITKEYASVMIDFLLKNK